MPSSPEVLFREKNAQHKEGDIFIHMPSLFKAENKQLSKSSFFPPTPHKISSESLGWWDNVSLLFTPKFF